MSTPKKYRKRPVLIEAIQWTGDNPYAVRAFTGMHKAESGEHFVFTAQSGHDKAELFVAANGRWLPIVIGEWIIKDALGFYPCHPEVFAETYAREDTAWPEAEESA